MERNREYIDRQWPINLVIRLNSSDLMHLCRNNVMHRNIYLQKPYIQQRWLRAGYMDPDIYDEPTDASETTQLLPVKENK